MAPRRRRRSDRSLPDVGGTPGLSSDDIEILDAFCRDIQIEEVSFEKWVDSQDTLDLTLPVSLTAEEAGNGARIEINWTRTIHNTEKTLPRREKRSHELQIVGPAREGQTIVLKGFGDQRENRSGDLRVIIHIK